MKINHAHEAKTGFLCLSLLLSLLLYFAFARKRGKRERGIIPEPESSSFHFTSNFKGGAMMLVHAQLQQIWKQAQNPVEKDKTSSRGTGYFLTQGSVK